MRAVLEGLCADLGLGKLWRTRSQRNSVAFTIAVIALCAKMSKADGVSTSLEAQAFQEIFQVPPEERANVERLYDVAKQDVAGYDVYADKVARLLADEPDLKRNVLDALFHIAAADGIFHGAEDEYLADVARRFGFSEAEYRAIRGLFVRDPDDPYTVLGVWRDISDHELKAHYRRLARESHPDVLMGRGVPEKFICVASRKLAALNAAYNQIAKERAL